MESFLHQIKNKMILVAIVGEGSCGKSTLVNALLRNRYTYIAASKEFMTVWLGSYHQELGKLLALGYLLHMMQKFIQVLVNMAHVR